MSVTYIVQQLIIQRISYKKRERHKFVTHKLRFSYFINFLFFFTSTIFSPCSNRYFVIFFHQKSSFVGSSFFYIFLLQFFKFLYLTRSVFSKPTKPNRIGFVDINENRLIFITFWILVEGGGVGGWGLCQQSQPLWRYCSQARWLGASGRVHGCSRKSTVIHMDAQKYQQIQFMPKTKNQNVIRMTVTLISSSLT
jgi:hypothetical protein